MKYHHGNLKEELISSACKICEASGHDHMSLRSIAKEASVSQTAPYRHFKTKECLLAEVSKRGFEELTERLRAATSEESKATQKIDFLKWVLPILNSGWKKEKPMI
jgi:AcrR family transcriptional regulator